MAYGGGDYATLKRTYGQALATKMVEFTFRSIRRTRAIIEDLGDAATPSEFRTVSRIRTFGDQESFDEVKASIAEFIGDNPQYEGMYDIIDDRQTLQERYNVHGVVGAVIFEAAALWPYRLIMAGWEDLLNRFPAKLNLEAQTVVSNVKHTPAGSSSTLYVVNTTRGEISARQVAYCTNGYTGNLIPAMRGPLYPYRGIMTVQDLGGDGDIHNKGAFRSWSIHQQSIQAEGSTEVVSSVHYLQQNAKSSHYFFGGGTYDPIQVITGDDTHVPVSGVKYLQKKLSHFLGQKPVPSNRLVSSWTGIMGFTADENPLIGRLPTFITSRLGKGEWVAAGFNGMGMSLCVAIGEALAYLMQGENVDDWLPEAFIVSESRLHTTLSTKKSVQSAKQHYGGDIERAVDEHQYISPL